MKKLLLFACAALMTTAASAQWAVVGAYSNPNWNFAASTTFEGEGNDLTCTISHLTNDFKIVDITNNNWDVQYGTSTPLEINTPIVLDGKNGGDDPSNMSFAGLIQAVNNATVKWNPSTATLEIVAEESDLEIAYPTLYATGSFCDWNTPGEGNSVKCTENNGVYTVKINLGQGDGKTEFKLAGTGWSNEIAGGVEITDTKGTAVSKGGDNLFTYLTGEQTLTFNYNTMVMTFGDPSLVNETATAVWAVVGAYSNPSWNFDASTTFEGEGNDLTCTISHLTNDFKIVDIANNNWDVQYGTSTPLEINTPIVLDGKNGGDDPSNMSFAGLIQAVNNATVKWNPSTATLEIVAEESDLEIAYPTLYATGSFCEWNAPGEGNSVKCTENNGIYTVTINLGQGDEEGKTEFKLASEGWSNEIAGGVEITDTTGSTVTKGGDNLFTYLTGEQTLTFNIAEMKMTFGNPELATIIDAVVCDENSPVVFYNLQGVRVEKPANGLYIRVQGNTVSKVLVK